MTYDKDQNVLKRQVIKTATLELLTFGIETK